jgi:hypothetical protein
MRDAFREIVHDWTLLDDFDELTDRIERAAAWTEANGPLEPDEAATVKLMIESQVARGMPELVERVERAKAPPPLTITDTKLIGENDVYSFWVARCGERFIGYARESRSACDAKAAFAAEGLPTEPSMMFLFPEISDGVEMGTADRDRAIKLTGALAQDPEQSYGGVARWHVPPELRGAPDDFRCPNCDRVGCDGSGCGEDFCAEDF